jgi:hypothetical protein
MGGKKPGRLSSLLRPQGHKETQALLHVYAHEILMDTSAEARYPAVASHLAQCPRCLAMLNELLDVTRSVMNTVGRPAIVHQKPNLLRLSMPKDLRSSAQVQHSEARRSVWLELTSELLRTWQPSTLLGAARGALIYDSEDESLEDIVDVRVRIFREDDPAYVSIMVTIDRKAGMALDQSGLLVALHGTDFLQQQITDQSGVVRFAGVPSASLTPVRLSITLDQSA